MITLNPDDIGKVDLKSANAQPDDRSLEQKVAAMVNKKKARGKSGSLRKLLNKRQNVVDARKELIRAHVSKEERKKAMEAKGETEEKPLSYALERFRKKS